jgi:hypothetical protein
MFHEMNLFILLLMNINHIIFLNFLIKLLFSLMLDIFDIVIQIIILLSYLFYIAVHVPNIANQIFLIVILLILVKYLPPLDHFSNNPPENQQHP